MPLTTRGMQLGIPVVNPFMVMLLSPADGALTGDLTPTFTWSAVSDADSYEIQIANDAGFTDIIDSDTGLTSPTYTPSELEPDGLTVYWRVRVDSPTAGPWSARSFTYDYDLFVAETVPLVDYRFSSSTGTILRNFADDAAVGGSPANPSADKLNGEGVFDAAGNWSPDAQWAIGSGVATYTDGVNGSLVYALDLGILAGKTVLFAYRATSAGNIHFTLRNEGGSDLFVHNGAAAVVATEFISPFAAGVNTQIRAFQSTTVGNFTLDDMLIRITGDFDAQIAGTTTLGKTGIRGQAAGFGPEVNTNPDFDFFNAGWSQIASGNPITFAGGQVSWEHTPASDTNTGILQSNNNLIIGNRYIAYIDIPTLDIVSGQLWLTGASGATNTYATFTESGNYEIEFVAAETRLMLWTRNNIDDVTSVVVERFSCLPYAAAQSVLGPELFVNPTFPTWSGAFPTDTPDGWGVNGTQDANTYVTNASPGARMFSTSAFMQLAQAVLSIGETYRTELEISAAASGSIAAQNSSGNNLGAVIGSVGPHIRDYVADGTSARITRSGTPTDMTIQSASVKRYTGVPHAMYFDGLTSIATLPNQAAIQGLANLTFTGVFCPLSYGEGGAGRIFEKDSEYGCAPSSATGLTVFATFSGTSISEVITLPANTLRLGVSHSLVFIINDTTKKITVWVDGVKYTSVGTGTGTRNSNTNPIIVGNRAAIDRTFFGTIDELKLHTRAFSDAEARMFHLTALGGVPVGSPAIVLGVAA